MSSKKIFKYPISIKKCSSLLSGKRKLKPQQISLPSTRMTKMKKQKQNRYAKRRERYVATGTHILLGGGGGVNWYNHFGKLLGTIY